MTATMLNRAESRRGAMEPPGSTQGAAFLLLPGRIVAYAWLLAAVPTALLQLVHADLHEHNEPAPVIHWLRDTSLAVPFSAIAVVVAALLVARARPGQLGERTALTTVALWGCLAAAVFAVLSIPGSELHGLLFGAEEEVGVGLLQDLATDALYALEAALLVLVPLSLLAGVPWRGAWWAARATQFPAQVPGSALAASAGRFDPPATAGSTHTGGDR